MLFFYFVNFYSSQKALEQAKEAERKEKSLMDLKKRLTPNNEQINLDLNYAVS